MKSLSLVMMHLFLTLALFAAPAEKPKKMENKINFPSRGEIMKKFDTNNDGKLSEEERKNLRNEMSGLKTGTPLLLAKKFDKDGDGKLSEEERSEFRKDLASKGRRLPPHLMQRFDTNGDGELSDEERSGARQAWEDRKQEMLNKFDADGDGTLNVEERREAIKQAKVNAGKEAKEVNSVEGNKQNPPGKKKGDKPGEKGR
jgi:Ca2+-binding EF-hand superfamily protein